MSRVCLALIASALLLAGCLSAETQPQPADLVFRGGAIYTVAEELPWAEALAVVGDTIVWIGDDDRAAAHVGSDTQVVDLQGAMLMPGMVDSHVHPVRGALKELRECNFPFTATPTEIERTLSNCATHRGGVGWIVGGQWDSGFFENFPLESPREWLDAVVPDQPVVLRDDSLHNVWVNTVALQAAGFWPEAEDPDGGRFERDSQGRPNGVLLEYAAKLMNATIPEYSLADRVAAAGAWSRTANGFGITAAKAAASYDAEVEALGLADRDGDLTVHMAVSLRLPDGARSEPLDYASIEARRDLYASAHVDTRFVKFFLDGVPTPARTAAMLAPYADHEAHPPGFTGGSLLVPMSPLAQDITELDRRGFTAKLHAAGDRSVRVALDAIGAARSANGDSGLIHELAHAGFVDPQDIPRFKQLRVAADLSPVLWHPSPIIASIESALGKQRAKEYFPVRDYLDSGALVIGGSDWPAGVPSANPWVGIEAFVTRRDPTGKTQGALWPEQAIELEEAIRIYTINGAIALRKLDRIGSLEVGKSADMIVLDRNLFDVAPDSISETQVRATYFEGRLVYSANEEMP